MEDLYRICQYCQGTGDEDTPDGPPCNNCKGIGFVVAYQAYQGDVKSDPTNRALYPPVTNAPAQQPPPPPQRQYTQQSSYQQQAATYTPGTSQPTEKQQAFMDDLIARLQLSGGQADEIAQTMFGVKVPALDKQMASKFIEELQKRDQAARATAQAAGAPPF